MKNLLVPDLMVNVDSWSTHLRTWPCPHALALHARATPLHTRATHLYTPYTHAPGPTRARTWHTLHTRIPYLHDTCTCVPHVLYTYVQQCVSAGAVHKYLHVQTYQGWRHHTLIKTFDCEEIIQRKLKLREVLSSPTKYCRFRVEHYTERKFVLAKNQLFLCNFYEMQTSSREREGMKMGPT